MKITEQVYEGGTPYKISTISDANRENHFRKCKVGEAASPTNPKKAALASARKTIQSIQVMH